MSGNSGYWELFITGFEPQNEQGCTEEKPSDYDETEEPFGETEDLKDVISQVLFENFPCEGVVLEEETFKELKRTGKSAGMRAFFSEMPDINALKQVVYENLAQDVDLTFELTPIEDKDWSEEWKKSWMPAKISEKIVIRPTWREYEPKDGEIIVNLDPGMAFGTGAHATTQLCVLAMEKYMPQNAELADVGCGSGILAICGIKLGAKSAIAVDNDSEVIPVAKDNATLNNVEDRIKFFAATSSNLVGKTYDFVCANILHNVLDSIMGELKMLLKPGAKLSLSGILDEKEHIVKAAIEREGLKLVERMTIGHWVGLVVEI